MRTRKLFNRDEITELMNEGYSETMAKELLYAKYSTSPFARTLRNIMDEYGCGYSTAKYIYIRLKKDASYNPHLTHYAKVSYEVYKNYIPTEVDGVKIVLFNNAIIKTFIDSYGHARARIKINGKYRDIMFASLVWMQHNKQDIPQGYIINHKDTSDKLNDDIENLELIPSKLNTSLNYIKDHKGHTKI